MSANRKAEVEKAVEDVDFSQNDYQVVLNTSKGKIVLDVYGDTAPGHAKNIIGLARIGFYDGVVFHRVIEGFMIQGGCPQGTGTGGPGYTIPAEFNSKSHEPGVLSMARTSDPDSAGSQFFLCVARVPHLDNQYTVFGKTADEESLKNVLEIGNVKTNAQDRPLDEVKIESAEVLVNPKAA
ncbi:Putative bifunctional phosphatase/peptidyl-prolyl cis-trans isomerase [Polystyrenella longa]|uniref:Peptidyl-prolyl cis-trans isomerase n=1 Tax=Polystyrenella longa TaxID=2528007 RepID=A0A518CL11_9PLAN|nr:peptidylprolyl isomerase [Polystyrenella longa]QDU79913.1 Putative bifunctional phosphatase/peptidyl-prolyl cis-trans isomerase [Polystyrenella longa]